MIDDVDGLMAKYDVDALFLQGKSLLKPNLYYLTRFLTVDDAYYVKFPDQPGILAASDIVCSRAKKYSPMRYFHSLSPTINQAIQDAVSSDEYVQRILEDLLRNFLPKNGVIGVPLETDALHIHLLQKLGLKLQPVESLFFEARETKDRKEIKAIESASQATMVTFNHVIDLINNTTIGPRKVLLYQRTPLTVGRLKRIIEHTLVDNDSESSEEIIVASGPKGADYHYMGARSDLLRANVPVIIDIFPRRLEERYHADVTRTIVRGQVSQKIQKLFESVESALDAVVDAIHVGETTEGLVNVMADSFEWDGHPSANRTPGIEEGMLHALGHGIGLSVHEDPKMSFRPHPLKSGAVIAIEPALYYKKVGGIRIEDDIVVTKKGSSNLTNLPRTVFL
ncbi:MAG: M24 family metallopeptidase [Promethearchaeota archaeon]